MLRPGQERVLTPDGAIRYRQHDLNASTRPELPANALVDTRRTSWQAKLKTGIPLPRIAKARDIPHARSLGPRADFKALQPRTARGFQSSGILEAGPPTAGPVVNKQKWRKNFRNVIYAHVFRPHVFCADTSRFVGRHALDFSVGLTREIDNRMFRGHGRVRCCFSCISKTVQD